MSEPPLSGAFQVRCEAAGSRVPERQGGLGATGSAVSRLANKLLPPDCRATRMKATKSSAAVPAMQPGVTQDRKSTRLNSSHRTNSYAVFCLQNKKKQH